MFFLKNGLLITCCLHISFAWLFDDPTPIPEESWTGRWFPDKTPADEPEVTKDIEHDTKMGIVDPCDDGKTNLTIDNSGEHTNYLCMHPRNRFVPDPTTYPVIEYENIPVAYVAEHRCMNKSISYTSSVPTFGTHRKLWPIYGEYAYLPAQRWLHTLEHGGIVALYHPCADLQGISHLRKAVKKCLRRYVISPWPLLDQSRPFALVAWGVRQRMSEVELNSVRNFIQNFALRGPEKLSKDGQFDKLLITKAENVSDFEDSQLCPEPLAHD